MDAKIVVRMKDLTLGDRYRRTLGGICEVREVISIDEIDDKVELRVDLYLPIEDESLFYRRVGLHCTETCTGTDEADLVCEGSPILLGIV